MKTECLRCHYRLYGAVFEASRGWGINVALTKLKRSQCECSKCQRLKSQLEKQVQNNEGLHCDSVVKGGKYALVGVRYGSRKIAAFELVEE